MALSLSPVTCAFSKTSSAAEISTHFAVRRGGSHDVWIRPRGADHPFLPALEVVNRWIAPLICSLWLPT
jgi:hypothetical protein